MHARPRHDGRQLRPTSHGGGRPRPGHVHRPAHRGGHGARPGAGGRARALAGVPTLAGLALALAEGDAGGQGGDPRAAHRRQAPRGLRRLLPARRGVRGALRLGRARPELEVVRGPAVVPAAELQRSWLPGRGHRGRRRRRLYAAELPAGAHARPLGHGARRAAMVLRAWRCLACPALVTGADAVLPIYGRAPDAERWTARAVAARGGAA